jgi:hypothetical protein
MVAASILGLIGLAILTTFGSGFSIYERVQAYGGSQTDALLALEEIERDVRNIFPFATIPVEGETDRIAFPAVIETIVEAEGGPTLHSSIGKIAYLVDDGEFENKVLKKSRQNYSAAVSESASDAQEEEVLVAITDLAFRYYSYNSEEETYAWDGSWSAGEGSALKGVEITLTYKDLNRDVQLVRTVLIPTADNSDVEGTGEGDEEGGEEEG